MSATVEIPQELEERLDIYLFLKEKGLTLDEIAFIAQHKESWPELLTIAKPEA